MIVDKDENSLRNKANAERLNIPEDERKEQLLSELRQESLSIISLAYVYAKNFEETGMNITEKLILTEQQANALQQYHDKVFQQGVNYGVEKGREYERAKIKVMEKKKAEREQNEHFYEVDDGIDVDRLLGKNTISEPSRNVVQPVNVQSHGKGKRKRHKR